MSDHNNQRVIELLALPGNNTCADCLAEAPEYGSYNLGVFLCADCATIHQRIGAHISKVKSLTLAKWTDDLVHAMQSSGNIEAKKKYEKYVPICYKVPNIHSPKVLLEQWIRAKYERLEFIHVDEQSYTQGVLEDTLLVKRKKDDGSYIPKFFFLSEQHSALSIFAKEDAKGELKIPLAYLNICLSPAKMNRDNAFQLSWIEDGATRHIYVMHDSGKVIIDWYTALRNAKLHSICVAYPQIEKEKLIPYLTNDFTMEGWVSKTGPQENDAYRKRWCTLDNRKFMYHLNPMDEFPRGEFFIGTKSESYEVKEGLIRGNKEVVFTFSLVTPDRTYVFSVSSENERQQWIQAIDKVINRPLEQFDNKIRTLLDPSKRKSARFSWLPL